MEREEQGDLRHRAALRRPQGPGLRRRVPRRLHLRGEADAVHPPRRVRGLRSLRAGVPGGGHLLRGRHPGAVEGLLHRQRRLLRGPRFTWWRREDGGHRQGPPADRGPAVPAEPGMTDNSSAGAPTTVARWAARSVSSALPEFPWDRLAEHTARARAHPDGVVDLSVGTPVDPTPDIVQKALADATDSPGYPMTVGRAGTRQACVDWLARRFGVTGLHLDGVL